MSTDERWTYDQAGQHCGGVAASTYRSYVARQGAPAADQYDPATGRKMVDAAAVRQWWKARPGRGARTDLRTQEGAAEGFLRHLKANPTLLDPAPIDRDEWGAAMNHRAYDESHSCLRCGRPAKVALIADTPDRPRFLDLCAGCRHWLTEQVR